MKNRGQFRKGESGNPGGRPKEEGEIRQLAKLHGPDAIRTLADIMKNSAKGNERLSAAQALLDRGFGRPPQAMQLDMEGTFSERVQPTPVINLTISEWMETFGRKGPGM